LGDEESADDARAFLFNSVHLGLDQDTSELDREELLAAIEEELTEDTEEAMDESWETIKQQNPSPKPKRTVPSSHHVPLKRTAEPFIEILLTGLNLDFNQYLPNLPLTTRLLVTSRELDIIDHVKSSTWRRFLTSMRYDLQGNIRESESNMVRVELVTLKPAASFEDEEARLRAKFLPLRLHVDQDALDFLKAFGAFQHPDEPTVVEKPNNQEMFFREANFLSCSL
jgi:autophagy-related protein 2